MKRALTLAGLVGAALLAAVSTGCGGHAAKNTALELVATGFSSKAVFRLRCDPPGGDIAHPARACAALKENPDALLHPTPFICQFGSWDIKISGRFKGRAVNVKTNTCWTPQMELIKRLGIAHQLDTHFVSYGPRRGLGAKIVNIPAKTPAWLSAFAQSQAVLLQDPHPDRVLIEFFGDGDVVDLWGDFHCAKPCRFKYRGPAGQALSGNYARIKVDPKTRTIVYADLSQR
jgi:hypothetical protein